MYLVVYNSNENKTISRMCSSMPLTALNGTNGYGWEVITIQEIYNKSFYTRETILKLIEEDRKRKEEHNWRINKFITILDTLINA